MTILGKNSANFSKIGKVYLLNCDFSANWEYSRSVGNFSANWEKIWYRKPDPVLYREKALAKRGESQEKPPDTPASRTWLVSHLASTGLEPTPVR